MKALSKNGLVLALVAILLGPAAVGADHLAAVQVLDADQLKAWIDQGNKMLLVDSRVASEYNEGHIPTAISIPAPVMDQYRAKLPSDHNYPLVFYCNGWPECKKSHDASSKGLDPLHRTRARPPHGRAHLCRLFGPAKTGPRDRTRLGGTRQISATRHGGNSGAPDRARAGASPVVEARRVAGGDRPRGPGDAFRAASPSLEPPWQGSSARQAHYLLHSHRHC